MRSADNLALPLSQPDRRKHFPFAAPHLPIRDSRAPLSNQRGHVILRRKTMDHSHYVSL